ncbi:(2Fe-2S)-binding protein [Pseudoalteromonas sp. GB43]
MRKTCCLHYQLVTADYCANCPLNKKGTSAC